MARPSYSSNNRNTVDESASDRDVSTMLPAGTDVLREMLEMDPRTFPANLFEPATATPAHANEPYTTEAARSRRHRRVQRDVARHHGRAINLLPHDTGRVELLTFIIKHNIVRDGDFCDENLTTLEILNDLRIAVGNYPFKMPASPTPPSETPTWK